MTTEFSDSPEVTKMKRHTKLLALVGSVLALGLIPVVGAATADAGTRHDAIQPVVIDPISLAGRLESADGILFQKWHINIQ